MYSGMVRGDKHWREIWLCKECDGGIEVHLVHEYDTGKTYLTDESQDLVDKGCPKCGAEISE